MLKQLRGQIHDLRQQLDEADHERRFCDIAASPLSRTTSTSNPSTPRSSLAGSEMSSCETEQNPFQPPPELPYLCRLTPVCLLTRTLR